MHHIMARFWWILALRGGLGILLGLASLGWILILGGFRPDLFGSTLFAHWAGILGTLILLLGMYAFLDGAFSVILGAQDYGEGRRWWALVGEGIISLALGAAVLLKPDLAAMTLLYWLAAWALLTGILEIRQAFNWAEYEQRRTPFFFAGLCSLFFGLMVLLVGAGGIPLVWLTAAYAFASGIPLMVLALRLRRYAKAYPHPG